MKRIISLLFILSAPLFLIACSINNKANNSEIIAPDKNNATEISTDNPLILPGELAKSMPSETPLTFATVATHNQTNDCWLVIKDKVYDVTSYVKQHPGGETILKGCGKEATQMFELVGKHRGQAQELLAQYLLGPLQK